jgi:hypothetical protein
MKKNTLTSFINKYSLNGNIESVRWVVDSNENKIKTSSISYERDVLCFVEIKDSFGLESHEIGVNDTIKLQKLLGVLGDSLNVTYNKTNDKITSLGFESNTLNVHYVTADISVIPNVPNLKSLPEFNLEIPLTKEFVSKFVKSKNALSEVDTFTLTKPKKVGGKIKLVIGYSSVNTNRISMDVDTDPAKNTLEKDIKFSAKYLKEILTSNSECENAVLKVSDGGLAHVRFETDEFECNYYLVKIENID